MSNDGITLDEHRETMTVTNCHAENYILIKYDPKAISISEAEGHFHSGEYINPYLVGNMNKCIKKSIEHYHRSIALKTE